MQNFPAPLWKQPWSKVEPEIASTRAAWSSEINWESSQPPLYYALAGLWWRLGQSIGLTQIESLYWIRFLNGLLASIVVWLGYVIARTVGLEHLGFTIGVPCSLHLFHRMCCTSLAMMCCSRFVSARCSFVFCNGSRQTNRACCLECSQACPSRQPISQS